MSGFENKCCKILAVMLVVLIVYIGFQLMGCSTPSPPSDYIDEVDVSNLA